MYIKHFIFITLSIVSLLAQANVPVNHKIMPVTQDPKLVERIQSVGWLKPCDAIVDKLVLITVPYWGFDHQSHEGQLIVHQAVAKDLQEIFTLLHQQHFPITQIKTVDHYQNNDEASMRADNTSAFNCRVKTGYKDELSNHGYGIAIDINPRINPYVKGDLVLPENGKEFVDRKRNAPGMITRDSPIYKLFSERGWEWGGDWTRLQDYQHFEKPSVIQ